MTIKDFNTDEELIEILDIFYQFGLNELGPFTAEMRDTHKLSPRQFYFTMISLLEAFIKYFADSCDRTACKELFDNEERQDLVNFISKALSAGAIKLVPAKDVNLS